MFGFGGVFRRKPRQFDYRPRYYDPEKEAREERRKELFGEQDEADDDGSYKPGQYIRRDMKYRRGMTGRTHKKRGMSFPLMIGLLLILGIAVYWVLT